MEDLFINNDKFHAIEIISELEDIYISKINNEDSDLNRQKLEPLRKSINYLRSEYELDDATEYLYSQYIKSLRYNILYSDIMEDIKNENNGSEFNDSSK